MLMYFFLFCLQFQVPALKIVTFAKKGYMSWNECLPKGNFSTGLVFDATIAIFYSVLDPMSTIVITQLFLENSSVFHTQQKMLQKNTVTAKKLMRLRMHKIGNIPNYSIGQTRIGELQNHMLIGYGIEIPTKFEVIYLSKSLFQPSCL